MKETFASTSDYIRWNEEMSRHYDPEDYHLRSSFFIRWIERRRVQAIIHLLNAGRQDTVVEVGCGAGVVLTQIPAGRRIGLDLSEFLLRKYRHSMVDRQVVLLQANGECLPFPDNSLTHLVCTEVIEHVPHPAQVARELARVGSREAVIVITIPNEALITRVKNWIQKLGLSRWLLQGSGENAYDSPGGENEWHLHEFDLPLLKQVTFGKLELLRVKTIPWRVLPFRYVIAFRPVKNSDEKAIT